VFNLIFYFKTVQCKATYIEYYIATAYNYTDMLTLLFIIICYPCVQKIVNCSYDLRTQYTWSCPRVTRLTQFGTVGPTQISVISSCPT